MKKQLVIIGIVVILVTVGLCGCNTSPKEQLPKDRLIGAWVNEDDYPDYTFYDNGSVYIVVYTESQPEFWSEYTIEGNRIIFTGDNFYGSYQYSISDDNQQLILDNSIIYQRK